MAEIREAHIGKDSYNYTESYVFFENLSLEHERLKLKLDPILQSFCAKLEFVYNRPASIEFSSALSVAQDNLMGMLQFDDVCIRLLHVDSQKEFYITLPSKLARILLIRLLSTSLVDDSLGLLFSSTEKGIFSFIVARMIFELKKSLKEKMPNIKLLGVYHSQDQILSEVNIKGLGCYNFSMKFDAYHYPIILTAPKEFIKPTIEQKISKNLLFVRAGHISRYFSLTFKKIMLNYSVLEELSFGDLILFDNSTLKSNEKKLSGVMKAFWDDLIFEGELDTIDNNYFFKLTKKNFLKQEEDEGMEEVQVSGFTHQEGSKEETPNVKNIAQSINVPVSIEIARVPMTLKEICNLKEGTIIDLNKKIEDPLEIVIDKKVIGYCTPVKIDGRLGIRILRIDNEKDSQVA